MRLPDGLLAVWPGKNQATTADRFDLGPCALTRAARAQARLVALYHSHPRGPAAPSARDAVAWVGPFGPWWPGVELWIVAPNAAGWAVGRFAWDAATATLAPASLPLPQGAPLGEAHP